jgi:PhnB protein
LYRDGAAALDYLTRVFGFTERMRTTTPDGAVGHAEVQLGESIVMIGCPPEFVTPKELGEATVGLYVHVDDVDDHYRLAVEAGAQPDEEPTDQRYGVRTYGVKDPEGHQWWFSQPLTAV